MELIFQNVQGRWIAEFELTADAAIHIEGVKEGDISLWQRSTASGKYAFVRDSRRAPTYGTVYDYEIPALITPKFIKVECMTEPTFAEVISSGEITELKFQDKTVEVTSNGTTTITPDNGFAALNSVNVKVNVPQSGEGGGSSKVRYFNVKPLIDMDLDQAGGLLKMFPGLLAVKAEGNYVTSIVPMAAISSEYYDEITSAAILDNFRGFIEDTNDFNSSDLIPQLLQFGCTEITEEEFYTL